MNARPIWTQSGIGPKFIQSRVNGALILSLGTLKIDSPAQFDEPDWTDAHVR